jgi:alkaline phosphatase
MGITTVTAARILDGQRKGGSGEDNALAFEAFPNVALSKTYSANQQTPDSAPTMTAMVTGVKTDDGLIAVSQRVPRREPRAEVVRAGALRTILEWAEDRGLSTGVVTTTRVTHATPAACYAHVSERDWEGDADLPAGATVADIARQLVDFDHGDGLEVALGGGRSKFYTVDEADPEYERRKGTRRDGRSLWSEWARGRPRSAYVWNKAQFDAVDPAATDRLLGLFEPSHMKFEIDRAKSGDEPSLAEMTEKALAILAKNPKGYFLMVEGGRIDHAHHLSNAHRALTDAIAFSDAVARAVALADPRGTLVIVTADHSHVFTMAGYPKRGNPILGKVVEPGHAAPDYARDLLGRPYTTLGYANGPGYTGASNLQPAGSKRFQEQGPSKVEPGAGRPDLSEVDTEHPDYLQESAVPAGYETHGGEDVAIYATGPGAHLVRGVMEQNAVFHVMREAFGWK